MRTVKTVVCVVLCLANLLCAQEPDETTVIRGIDQAVNHRYENVLGFTDTEHYSVFRGNDETHPFAEMTVKDTYRKGVGKAYTILTESGSALARKFGLRPLLDTETTVNKPGNIEQSWFDSANYEMHLKPGGPEQVKGRLCYVLTVTAKRKAPNTISGSIWVDVHDYTLAKIEGTASKNPSPFAGPTKLMREYVTTNGLSMAVHARAESNSVMGRMVVTIDYSDYHLELAPER